MTHSKLPLSTRFFKLLLRLLPADFRWDYAREMESVFHEQQEEAKRQGSFRELCSLWWETVAGILQTAPREHWEILKRDCGYALRNIRQNPSFALLSIVTLALGIGANTAIFSVVNGVLLRPLPYDHSERVVRLRQVAPAATKDPIPFSVQEIQDYRSQSHSFDGISEYHSMWFTLLGAKDPERVSTGIVSANFFDVLGVKPILGRNFFASDETMEAPPVLLLSNGYWKQHWGGRTDVIGKTVELNDRVHTIVGILPPLPNYPGENDVYMPSTACPFRSAPAVVSDRNDRMLQAFARIKPGVSAQQATADLRVIAERLVLEYPKIYPKDVGFSATFLPVKEELTQSARLTFFVLLATAVLVLLLACANVANLTLSRQIRRSKEMAIRTALGAQRARIFRQLLTESAVVSLAGGLLGLLLASASLRLLIEFASRLTTRTDDIHIDTSVLLFTLSISLLTGVIFGSLPALAAGKVSVSAIHEAAARATGGQSKKRLNDLLVISQVAISLVLLVGAGLMIRSLYRILSVDPGFKAENVVTMQISLNWTKYKADEAKIAFYRNVLEQVHRNPSIHTAAISMSFPLDSQMGSMDGGIQIEGRPMQTGAGRPHADFRVVSDDYFDTIGTSLLRGRTFRSSDNAKALKVAIINERMAQHYWTNQDPIGRRVSPDDGKTWLTIVGVAGNVHQYGLDHDTVDELYLPIEQAPLLEPNLLVRTNTEPMFVAQEVIRSVHEVDALQPVTRIKTLKQIEDSSIEAPRIMTTLLGLFAVLALLITAAGIGGMLSLAVSQRRQEIGIRMALGADRGDIFSMVLRQGLVPVGIGLLLGAFAAMACSRALSGFLFEIKPGDPATFFSVGMILACCALVACLTPANRATRVDPMHVIRNE